ncbi:MAG: hypothetical protein JW712_05800 [Dehalococcoidales bacterium]|nr:hypothetical protein [Dehalococcoidales bacterium]
MTDTNVSYEVLSPWAEADPVPMEGLTAERVNDLNGKKIGMFCNIKQASNRIMPVLERRIKERYSGVEFSYFRGKAFSVAELEPDRIDDFNTWIDEVDTVILAVGD